MKHTLKHLFLIFTLLAPLLHAQSETNPGTLTVDPNPFRAVVVVSDIHGMYDQVKSNLASGGLIDSAGNWSGGNTLLIIDGDSIDKGPQSLEVLDLWIRLQAQAAPAGGLVIHLLGNHEAEFLADPGSDAKATELKAELTQQNVPLSDLTGTQTLRGRFLHQEPLALKVGAWLFCHSGFYPRRTWSMFSQQAQTLLTRQSYDDDLLLGDDSVLEAKNWEGAASVVLDNLTRSGFYGVVFGHQPKAFGIKGRSAALNGGRLIKIDNGMAPEAGSHPGSLLVFTQPAQMTTASFPLIKIVTAAKQTFVLNPE